MCIPSKHLQNRKGGHQNPQGRQYMCSTYCRQGVAMVVMDKSSYIEKCMALVQDTNVYQPCRDLTGQIHRQVQATLRKLKGKHGKDHQWVQLQYNQLLPTGNSSPPARFYGLPKIHKANCPMHPIVSACGISTYNLAKYLTKI